jgi:sulfur carrier protein
LRASRFIDLPEGPRVRSDSLRITLNGDPFDLDRPLSVADLLARLAIDPRRVAVEHNLTIVKREAFPQIVVCDGDRVEIVNFVGGG